MGSKTDAPPATPPRGQQQPSCDFQSPHAALSPPADAHAFPSSSTSTSMGGAPALSSSTFTSTSTSTSTSAAAAAAAPPSAEPHWVPYKQYQGITVYRYLASLNSSSNLSGMGGEYMSSVVVRGTPAAALAALLGCTCECTVLGPAVHAEVLRSSKGAGGETRQVLRLVSEAPGWAGRFCAPREWVSELNAQTESGMHIVSFNTVDNVYGQPQHLKSRSLYRQPVRGMARGTYAIAPLEGQTLDSSAETLVSCIVKVDLQGACGERSAQRPLSNALGWREAFLDRILCAPLVLRDVVERSRFVVKPDALLAFPLAQAQAHYSGGAPGARVQTLSPVSGHSARHAPITHDANSGFNGMLRKSLTRPSADGRDGGQASSSGRDPAVALPTPPRSDTGTGVVLRPVNAATPFVYAMSDASSPQPHLRPSSHTPAAAANTNGSFPAASPPPPAASTHGPEGLEGVGSKPEAGPDNGDQPSGLSVEETVGVAGVLDAQRIRSLATLEPRFWEEIHAPGKACPFVIRGANYLQDRKKIPADMAAFKFVAIDVISMPRVVEHVARFLPAVRQGRAPFAFVINLIIPGTPLLGIVSTFAIDRHPDLLGPPPADPLAPGHGWTPFDFVLHKFMTGDTPTRNLMLKLVPHIADGSWVIKHSVGTKPVITGKALKTTYHVTPQYMEVDIDVSADQVASYVTGLVRGATKSLVIDIGFVLEGTKPWELPEKLLGAMRVNWLDLSYAKPLDTSQELPLLPPLTKGRAGARPQGGGEQQDKHGGGAAMYSINENPLWDER